MSQTSVPNATTTPVVRNAPSPASLPPGALSAVAGAFIIWGLFPIYLFGLSNVSAMQITAHRVVWSCVFVLGILAARRELGTIATALGRPGVLIRLIATAVLVTLNWLAFVYAVGQGHVVEVSLGYYINPLVNVLLGILVLKERLNRVQWIAVTIAALGVAYLTVKTGQLPWIALALAFSFGLYGLIRKTVAVAALPGLGIEMIMLTPFAAGYLIWAQLNGIGSFLHTTTFVDVLLLLSGIITATPLFLFSFGARQIPYSTVGILQYIAPSLQLACAVFFVGEPFPQAKLIGFSLIWAALVVYAADGLWRARQQRLALAAAST